jgi:hypothetical protein
MLKVKSESLSIYITFCGCYTTNVLRLFFGIQLLLATDPIERRRGKEGVVICVKKKYSHLIEPQALEFRTPLFPHLVPPAIMVWIFVWKYIFEPFIHILQYFVLLLNILNMFY